MSDIVIRELQATDTIPWQLFLLADPSKEMIKKYFSSGRCYVVFNKDEIEIIGEYIISQKENDIWELMNIAVREDLQSKGRGKQLLNHALETVRSLGGKVLEVGTGNSSTDQLHFYQKNGFHIVRFKKDFFTNNYPAPIIEDGIVCKDKIVLSRSL